MPEGGAEREQVIVGTAGHIDHGKTALVKALTGVDADTLAEEKRRGITIELGFVFLEGADCERQIVFIDVPGHERLIRTMVAGAANLDAALLLVAADEGVKPQTREHLEILRLLGVERGIVAVSKADLVEEERLAEVGEEVRGLVEGTFLEGAPVIPVSAVTGAGVEELRGALVRLGGEVPPRRDSGVFRMPVDRVFTRPGFGTVVAGTVLAGTVRVGDRVEVLPEGLRARVRQVQVHHGEVESSSAGRRTALNLPDLDKEALRRGQCLAAPGSLQPTRRIDAQLSLLGEGPAELKHRARVRVHLGTDEVIGRLVLLDRDVLRRGETAPVQFVLEAPTVAVRGDRLVLRSFSPVTTLGGGVVVEAQAAPHKRREAGALEGLERLAGDLAGAVEQKAREAGAAGTEAAELAAALGESEAAVREALAGLNSAGKLMALEGAEAGGWMHREVFEGLLREAQGAIERYFAEWRYHLHMPVAELRSRLREVQARRWFERLLEELGARGIAARRGPHLSLVGRKLELPPEEQEALGRIEALFREAGLSPPVESAVREELGIPAAKFEDLMTALLQAGRLARISEKVTYHHARLATAREAVVGLLQARGRLSVAELRDELGVSRKYALALLEHCDETGLTRREGDWRVLRAAGG